ncbi:UNVERIFIED_CONTAM: cyclin 4, putative [Hammondia hammondi]|eukprot:XP_008887253.1 cyclin 4, putative [Hammondia hammondi]
MANHIVLPPQKLLKMPPSVREGISPEVEIEQRVYGCHLIQKAGILLKLEAVSIASAQTILHRFFFRRSLKQFDVRRVATAALLLACKLEEDPHRVMHLIGVIHLLSQMEDCPEKTLTEDNLDDFLITFDSQDYELFRMDVFRCERYILRELGFMVSQTLVHPHRYILQYIHALFKGNFVPTSQLSQRAWGYLNDSMRTTLCCEVQPAVIAVGSIFLAACDLGIPLPKETGWHELFDVSWEDVAKVCDAILSLYTRPLPSYVKLAEPLKPSKPSLVAQSASKLPPSEASSSASGVAAAARQQLQQQQQILSSVVGGVSSSEGKAEEGKETDTGRLKNEDDPGRSGAETRHTTAGRDGEAVKKWLIYGPERSEARERASDRGTETGKSGGGDHVRPSEARRGENETSRTEHSSGTKSCGFSSAPRNAGFSGGERQAASGSGVSTEDSGRVKGAEHREDDSSSRRGDRRGPVIGLELPLFVMPLIQVHAGRLENEATNAELTEARDTGRGHTAVDEKQRVAGETGGVKGSAVTATMTAARTRSLTLAQALHTLASLTTVTTGLLRVAGRESRVAPPGQVQITRRSGAHGRGQERERLATRTSGRIRQLRARLDPAGAEVARIVQTAMGRDAGTIASGTEGGALVARTRRRGDLL